LKGVSSLKLLRESYLQVRRAGWRLINADVVFIGNEPRIGPMRKSMEALLLSALDGDGVISIRGTTTDGLGFTGRDEGLAAQAVAVRQSRFTASQTSSPSAYDATAPWAFVQNTHWLSAETNAAKSSRSPSLQSDGPRIARSSAAE